jgi:hypothetical protein
LRQRGPAARGQHQRTHHRGHPQVRGASSSHGISLRVRVRSCNRRSPMLTIVGNTHANSNGVRCLHATG